MRFVTMPSFLCIFLSSGLEASNAFIEMPVVLATNYSPAMSTDIRPGIGIGWTHFVFKYEAINLGYGALGVAFPIFRQGTNDVNASGLEVDLEARGYLAYSFQGTSLSFSPYVYLGSNVDLRATQFRAYSTQHFVAHGDFGIRGGLGLEFRFRNSSAKIEGGAGYAFSGFNLQTSIIFGVGIF